MKRMSKDKDKDNELHQNRGHKIPAYVSGRGMTGIFGNDKPVYVTITSVSEAYSRVTHSDNPSMKSYFNMSMDEYIKVIKTLINKPVEIGASHIMLLTDNINNITPDTTVLMWREEQNA